jgi:ABC-type transport system involved in multi-copper enzyme maturation permease subunit
MLSLYNIWTVARFEIKTLLRSWFFRIFAVGSAALLLFLNVVLFAEAFSTMPWELRGIPGAIPYFNLSLLTIVQSIMVIFLSSDFLRRDKKLDTTSVVYMRSMTNGDYVLGKITGILTVFLGLDIVVLFLAALIQILFADVPFHFMINLYYLLILSIPSLVFIIGLSFVAMILVRNQALTFLILLGCIAVTLFYFNIKLNYVFDLTGFFLPLAYSDFIGFGNVTFIIVQRAIYLFFGLGCVALTIVTFRRLPQSKGLGKVVSVLTVFFFCVAVLATVVHLYQFNQGKQLRQQIIKIEEQEGSEQNLALKSCALEVTQGERNIAVRAKLAVNNAGEQPAYDLYFSLNPGLTVDKIEHGGGELEMTRNAHSLHVHLNEPLPPGKTDTLVFRYHGRINENACYADVAEGDRERVNNLNMYKIDKRFSFSSPRYLLLTPESQWYPTLLFKRQAQTIPSTVREFIAFELSVKTKKGVLPISQGRMSQTGDTEYSFVPENPLPQMSLIIGPYEKRSITVDSVEYSLFAHPQHDYFVPYLKVLQDTLGAIIRQAKQNFENRTNLLYPYKRFSIVEVPIQFFAFAPRMGFNPATVQPEQALVAENGLISNSSDFKFSMDRMKERTERRNQTFATGELEARVFNFFLQETFLGSGNAPFRGGRNFVANYHIFPNYYHYVARIESDEWPLFDLAFESYLYNRIGSESRPFFRIAQGLVDEETANLKLSEASLADILQSEEDKEIAGKVIKVKSRYLFSTIKRIVGEENFNQMIRKIVLDHRFSTIKLSDIAEELNRSFHIDLDAILHEWAVEKQLPGFVFYDFNSYTVVDRDRTRFQVRFKAANLEKAPGLIAVTFRSGGFGPFGGGPPSDTPAEEYLVKLDGETAKEIGYVLDEKPMMMQINSMVSKNLPYSMTQRFEEFKMQEKAKPFAGEVVLDELPKLRSAGEYIVDNEDTGFVVPEKGKTSLLKKILKTGQNSDEEEYIPLTPWRLPSHWRKTTNDEFYGKYIHSSHIIKSGDGGNKVAWKASLDESGTYDIYCYTSLRRMPFGRRRRGQSAGEWHFFIHHDDGVEEVVVDVEKAEQGWNFMGSFYISQGEAVVELSNKSDGPFVTADAIRWVKR